MTKILAMMLLVWGTGFSGYLSAATKNIVTLWIFGDSTVKDYTDSQNECSPLLKISGWGEFIQGFVLSDSLAQISNIITADSVRVDNRANGGRAARTFITGKDQDILRDAYANMQPGDYMFIQFGHNDEADCVNYPDRCTPVPDFKKYIGMYVDSVLSKEATPILITPMARYSWPPYNTHDNSDGKKSNQQVGNFSLAMQEVAKAKGVPCIDLTQRSIDLYNKVGSEVTQYQYFRKVRPGTPLPAGCTKLSDNTHFQPTGALELARQIWFGLQNLCEVAIDISDTARGTVTATSNGVKDKANRNFLKLTNDFTNGSGWYESTYNPEVTITAKATAGNKFVGWGGDLSGNDNPYTLTLDKSYNITAEFVDTAATIATTAQTVHDNGVIELHCDPVTSDVYLQLDLQGPAAVSISMFDLCGKTVATVPSQQMRSGKNSVALNNMNRNAGMYVCMINVNGTSAYRKMIIQ